MFKLATKALREALKNFFPELEGRVYNNWPGPEVQEIYPYMVVFTSNAMPERLEYEEVEKLTDGKTLFSTGYWKARVDVNYLAKEGLIEDQEALVDKISDFFNVQVTRPPMRESEISIDLKYQIQNHTAVANVRLIEINLDQTGPDLQAGDRRAIVSLEMYAPRFKVEAPKRWSGYKIEAEVKE